MQIEVLRHIVCRAVRSSVISSIYEYPLQKTFYCGERTFLVELRASTEAVIRPNDFGWWARVTTAKGFIFQGGTKLVGFHGTKALFDADMLFVRMACDEL